jgi:hypothetical protein
LVTATRRTALFLGSKNQAETLLVRSTSNDPASMTNLEQMVYDRLQECMDNVERAMLDPALSKKRAPPGTNMFFHITNPVAGCSVEDAKLLRVLVDRAIKKELLNEAERLVRLNMESVEVKVWAAGAQGEPMTPVRISATADMGWECVALKGISELQRGRASEWVDVETGETRKDLYTLTALETKLMKKRSIARRANSTTSSISSASSATRSCSSGSASRATLRSPRTSSPQRSSCWRMASSWRLTGPSARTTWGWSRGSAR